MRGLFTPAARQHIERLRHALVDHADCLDRRFQSYLRQLGCNPAQIEALRAVTPAACARGPSLASFIRQVEEHGRRLARLNLPPEQALEALEHFDRLVRQVLDGRFEPAREQLNLATRLVLDQAFYRVRELESRAFFALSRAEVEAADLDDLLRRFVDVLVRTFGASAGWLFLMEPGIQRRPARPRYLAKFGSYESVWSYPLGASAVVQLAFSQPHPWLPREQALLAAAAGQCQQALMRARLEGEVRRLEAEARHAEQEERHRIGRELHDEACQAMMALRLELEMIQRAAPAELRPRLAEACELAGRTGIELRRIVAALSPSVLERLGLEAALRQLTARFAKTHPARVRVRVRHRETPLSTPVQEVIYRVTQECLHNIAKHSRASAVNLDLHCADKSIKLSVDDNGIGFRADQVWKASSFGLAGMRQRAALLGGTIAIQSEPGKGTRIQLELPLSSASVISDGKDSCSIN